jgi:transposase
MTKKDLNNWIMYYEIHKLERLGFSNLKIARYLVIDARTVNKYLKMTEEDYEKHLLEALKRDKILSPFEIFVKDKLSNYQDTSAAQIHDWLKEHHPKLPEISPRTVYNFVMFVRQKHNLPFIKMTREYFSIQELPYGEQSQVDFGEYNMRQANGSKKKVKFFAMVLSRSRMKYVWFLDKPFTAETVCQAHENAFAFFGGIPKTVVYDQDRTMVVAENIGDIILTSTFGLYTKSRSFTLHFCRKADPESKGKVENVVQYVKKNFLYNRPYYDIEALNTEAVAWLGRTANYLPHNFTKKVPEQEFLIEKGHLNPYAPLVIENKENKMYHVRKTNTIAYKSNFYTLPMGTYRASGTQVIVKERDNAIEIYNIKEELICTHQLSSQKGQIIANTSHRRDTSKSLANMMLETASCFTDQKKATGYLHKIKERLPRYTRDHLQVILRALKTDKVEITKEAADKALDFCLKNEVLNGHEFEQVLHVYIDEMASPGTEPIKLLDKANLEKANQAPETSNLDDYENIINP